MTSRPPRAASALKRCACLLHVSLPASTTVRNGPGALLTIGVGEYLFPGHRTGQGPVDRRGGHQGAGSRQKLRRQAVEPHREPPARPHREAVPRAVAQPPEPAHQQGGLDRPGGPHHPRGAPKARQPMGGDRKGETRGGGGQPLARVQPGPRCISLLAYSPLLCLTAPHAFFDPLYLTACPLPANRRCCRAARTTPSRTTGTRP